MNRQASVILLAATTGLLSIAAVACKGGGGKPAFEVSRGDLPNMTLAAADFGAEYAGFEAGDENGFKTAEQRAQNSIDPAGEATDLERFGWEVGYEEIFNNPTAVAAGSGVWFVSSGAELFRTADGASGYFADSAAEAKEDVGKSREGIVLDAVEEFEVDLADEAAGGHFHVVSQDDPDSQYWATGISFRRGRLIAQVSMFFLEEQRPEDTLKDLAEMLDDRVLSVIEGGEP